MNNKPPIDRQLVIPIVIGGISIVGMIIVLIVGLSLNAAPEVPSTPSETPYEYIFLGTEPGISTPVVEESETIPPTEESLAVSSPVESTPTRPANTKPTTASGTNGIATAVPSTLKTDTPIPTSSAAGTYDDTDARITYIGMWISQSDVSGANQGTLHVSTGIGNSVTFTFTGTEVHLFYQAAPGLGTVIITIDALGGPPLNQDGPTTQIKEWVSDPLSNGTHQIVISHFAGGSVNIDSLFVQVPTPTPTRTPTSTQ